MGVLTSAKIQISQHGETWKVSANVFTWVAGRKSKETCPGFKDCVENYKIHRQSKIWRSLRASYLTPNLGLISSSAAD